MAETANGLERFLPTFEEVYQLLHVRQPMERFLLDCEYLFSIDDKAFFRMSTDTHPSLILPEENLYGPRVFRSFQPEYLAFAGITATQIHRFRLDRKYCGRCGHLTVPSTTERACVCPECGQIEYPKISPAVIIAIEETGLRVKNIRYYKSQPWSFSDSAMIGFYAKLDGDNTITLQESELGEAKWFSRNEVPDLPSTISVGQEMIALFKQGGDPFSQKN